MKWFHHETAARHDPKLQMLGSTHGAEGLGIFWGLLEEIGQHSDTFHLKVLGISGDADKSFANLVENADQSAADPFGNNIDINKIPRLPVKILAKNLFSSPRKLTSVIETCVEIGLFDSLKWLTFNVLYSPAFEQRADDYTRRLQRKSANTRTNSEQSSDKPRTQSEQSSNDVRIKSEKVLLETEAEQIQKENRNRTEKDMLANNTSPKNLPAEPRSGQAGELSTSEFYKLLKDEPYLIELSEDGFQEYSRSFRSTLASWNDGRPNKFDWAPADTELRKLFFGGEHEHKVTMCYHAFKLLGEKVHYPELVMRALKLMLKSSEKTRIVNPFGWLWSCLHGNGDGTTPWVQLLTAEEEQSLGSALRRYRPP
jgi:hypothetical protein